MSGKEEKRREVKSLKRFGDTGFDVGRPGRLDAFDDWL